MPIDSNNVVINMRVTANSIQGHRKYMEDCYKIRFQRESSLLNSQNKALLNAANAAGYFDSHSKQLNSNNDNNDPQSDILFSYFGIFDGHGGKEASQFAKEKLYWKIVEQKDFWSEDPTKVLNAIREGFIQCHLDMWNELANWPKTASGLPSTSGSTATVLFIRKSKAYVGHVGDSGLLIGYSKSSNQDPKSNIPWQARKLTRDHKPEDPIELKRIESMGGSVVTKSGVNRVVWNRPILNPASNNNNHSTKSQLVTSNSLPYDLNHYKHKPQQLKTERIPFLAVARSLGDLWSYDSKRDDFIVSPVPDVFHFDIDPKIHKCIILATDGLWNVMRTNECVDLVRQTDQDTLKLAENRTGNDAMQLDATTVQPFVNPSQRLVNTAMQRCCEKMIRADNTTCITIMIDEPPSLDDYLANGNDSIVNRATNLTCLDINKTFEKTRILNISNDFDEEELFVDDDNIEEYKTRRSRQTNSNRTFNQTTSTEIACEFNTPLNNDKRSKSLTSIRRRRWSASSNRSTSTTCKSAIQKTKFVNTNSRGGMSAGYDDISIAHRPRYHNLNKSNSSNDLFSLEKNRDKYFYNKSISNVNNANEDYLEIDNIEEIASERMKNCKIQVSQKHTLRINRHQTNFENRKTMNCSTISTGINKISKNIRKSFNDLYSLNKHENMKKSQSAMQVDRDRAGETKENNQQQKEATNKYAKHLKKFKNRIIQTKNNLLNKKRQLFAQFNSDEHKTNENKNNTSKHQSMPNLNKTDFIDKNYDDDEDEYGTNNDDNDEELESDDDYIEKIEARSKRTNNIDNQSFVNSVKSKLNSLKRQRIQASLKFEVNQAENVNDAKNKRIKFF